MITLRVLLEARAEERQTINQRLAILDDGGWMASLFPPCQLSIKRKAMK